MKPQPQDRLLGGWKVLKPLKSIKSRQTLLLSFAELQGPEAVAQARVISGDFCLRGMQKVQATESLAPSDVFFGTPRARKVSSSLGGGEEHQGSQTQHRI